MFGFLRKRRREAIRNRPFPQEWLKILQQNVPYFERLSAQDQRELQGHTLVLLEEKSFEGCAGLELTDEIKVTVAAQAALLLLHRETDYYPELDSILIYPNTFVTKVQKNQGGIVTEEDSARLGESWSRGVVVLAWDAVLKGARDMYDGHNVVLHEFAHQLDTEDGEADGAPILPSRTMYGPWARVLGKEFSHLVSADRHQLKTVMDKYGATNPAEFFAVITETFFEKPKQLKSQHPELYQQLCEYYQQDPIERYSR